MAILKPVAEAAKPVTTSSQPRANVRDCLRALATSIQSLKGVGPKRAAQLEASGLATVEDILYHLPFRFEDRRQLKKINQAVVGQRRVLPASWCCCKTVSTRAGAARCWRRCCAMRPVRSI